MYTTKSRAPKTLVSGQLADHRRFSPPENVLYVLLMGLFLLPIWLFQYLPLQDGPIHVHTADVLHEFLTGNLSAFQDFYRVNLRPVPNWTTQVILTGLTMLTSPIIAEKLLLSGYVILLPLVLRYALDSVRPGAFYPPFLAFLAFPFCFNLAFDMGFYNFVYSLVGFLLAVGYWLRHYRHLRLVSGSGLLLLSLGLYFTHLFSFVVFCLVVGTLNLSSGLGVLLSARRTNLKPVPMLWAFLMKTTVPSAIALLPACVLCLQYLSQNTSGSTGPKWNASLLGNLRLGNVLTLGSLVSYNSLELWLGGAIALFLLCLVGRKLFQNPRLDLNGGDGLLVATVVLFGVYFLAPKALSDSVTIKDRMLLYPFLTLILWLAARTYGSSLKQVVKWLLVFVAAALLSIQINSYAYLSGYATEYLSISPFIEKHSTLLAITFPTPREAVLRSADEPAVWRLPEFVRSWQINPFINPSGYVATERQAVLLNNYQATKDYFPINFRPELDPFKIMDADDWRFGGDPYMDILGYMEMTGRSIDYVSVWRTSDTALEKEGAQAIFQQLLSEYDLIHTSPERGYAQLYRRKQLASAP